MTPTHFYRWKGAGIDSPGLTSSPAIAKRVAELLEKAGIELEKKDSFQPKGDPDRIVCRCEQVTEATIVDALNRGISIDCQTTHQGRNGRMSGPFLHLSERVDPRELRNTEL